MSEDKYWWQSGAISEEIEKRIAEAQTLDEFGAIMADLAVFPGSEEDGHQLADDTLVKALQLICAAQLHPATEEWAQKFIADYRAVAKWFA